MNRMKWIVLTIVVALVVGGCSPGKTYERKLKRELASGVRYDSLFMGISLGMTEEAFYKHCWKLNDDSLVKQGTSNMSVEYSIKEELNDGWIQICSRFRAKQTFTVCAQRSG